MKININKFIKNSIYFVCIYMMVINLCCDMLKLPKIIRYIPDILIPIYIMYIISRLKKIQKDKYCKGFVFIILLYLLHIIICSVLNLNNNTIFYFIWGFRNIFRFLIISLCALNTFEKDDAEKFISIMHKLFWINFFVCIIQYFVFNLFGDAVGGTFKLGNNGGNAGVIYLIIIENTININNFINKKCSFYKMLLSLFCSIIITIVAELKVNYIFFIAITLLSILLNKFSLKTVGVVVGIILIILCGYNILEKVDPHTAEMLNIEDLMEYAGGDERGYSTAYDISRIRAFSQINEYFFKDDVIKKIWGYGLGNCDVSSTFKIFNSSFGQKYDGILHYTWFTHAMLYLETGMLGYIIYISIFIYTISVCFKKRKRYKENYFFYNSIIIIEILNIIMTIYNNVLKNDIAYFVYILSILPFILNKDKEEERNENISNIKKDNI